MTTFHFQTQVSESGVITLPPEYHGHRVVVSVNEERDRLGGKTPNKKKWKATVEEVREFMDTCYGCLEGLSDEEFEQMKMKRILGDH
jgi:hypothetical protein